MKTSVRFILAIAGLLLAAMAWSHYPVRLQPLEFGAMAPVHATPPPQMSVSALPTGSMSSRAAFAFRGGSFAQERRFAQCAVLIQHPQGDLLVDTGLGRHAREHFASVPWLMRQLSEVTLEEPAADRLARYGYDWRRLAGIVITHAHWDHISGVPDFAGVPLWLNAAEKKFIDSHRVASQVLGGSRAPRVRDYAFEGGAYLGFERSFDVFGDGSVVLVPLPGHTPGSIVVFVSLPSGRRFGLVGDLVWQKDGIDRPAERPWSTRALVDEDAEAVRVGIRHIAAIHRRFPNIAWLPAHDARAMEQLPVFPSTLR
jgi:N-acyl homoserine lactone hydrolase